ncbi:MAG: TonB family protein [Gemmatimonadetes bacterium]|nr:TonB family protein [Gemmatimonadota bacterium]
MVKRYAVSVLAGGIVTFAVLMVMQALIATAKTQLDESGTRHFVDFVRVERQESVAKKDRKPEKPPEPAQAPPQTPQPRLDSLDPVQASVNMAPVAVEADIEIGGLGLAQSDGEYLPIVRIAPVYPWKAQTQGVEGYCIVEFTVTEAGTVKDVTVVDAQPPGLFDKASTEAALKFKYRPRIVNGEPIEVRGVRNIFNYKLDN